MQINKFNIDEKNTKFKFSNCRKALKYIKNVKKDFFIILILDFIAVISSLYFTKIIQIIIDEIIPYGNYNKLYIMMLLALMLVIISIGFTKTYQRKLARMNFKIVENLKNDLFIHLQYLSSSYYDTRPQGKISIRLTDYAEKVSNLITENSVKTILNLINMAIVLIFMLYTNMEMTLIALTGIIILIIIFVLTARNKRRHQLLVNNKDANVNAYLIESLKGMEITKAFNRQEKNEEIFNNLSNEWKQANIESIPVWNIGWCSVQIMSHLVTASIYLIGILFLYPKRVTVGKIIAMGNYSTSFWKPIEELFSTSDEFINAITYFERILEILNEPVTIKDEEYAKDVNINGKIEFRNVKFSYSDKTEILKNISFKIHPNEKIAIVGETGSGKTTIANLITRFYDIEDGKILIDDRNIKDIKLKSLRKQISVMQQENYLFSTTILKNLKYAINNIEDNQVISICKKLKVHDWIMGLDNGYDTILKNNGSNLSDGEKQIICYIRTIISNPKILIFDEATSKLDIKTEKMIQNLTKEMMKDKTIITIAHRLSTIVNCDRIFFIKDKKIAESGTHKELIEKKGNYYNLYMSQINYY